MSHDRRAGKGRILTSLAAGMLLLVWMGSPGQADFFAAAPVLQVGETEPLATASIVSPALAGPGSGTAPYSYYVFGLGRLTEIQLDSGKVLEHPIDFDSDSRQLYSAGANSAWLGPDQRIYFGLHGRPARIGRFDPATGAMELLATLEGHTVLRHFWGPGPRLYVITYPATLSEIDITTGSVRHLGRLAHDALYVHGSMGISADGKLYATAGQRPQRHVEVDLASGVAKEIDAIPAYEPAPVPPIDTPDLDKLYKITLEASDDQATLIVAPLTENAIPRVSRFTCSTVQRDIGIIHAGPDGLIHGNGSYVQFTYDPATSTMDRPGYSLSVYGFLNLGDDLYLCGYPNARVGRLATDRPLALHGRRPLWTMQDDTFNPREVVNFFHQPYDAPDSFRDVLAMKRSWGMVLGSDGRIYVANSASRQNWGGALGIFDPQTLQASYVREPFRFLALHDLTSMVDEGHIVLVSSVAPDPIAPGEEPDEASLLLYDVEAGRVVFEDVPLPGCKVLRSIVHVPGTSLLVGIGLPTVDPKPQDDTHFRGPVTIFFYDLAWQRTLGTIALEMESNARFAKPLTLAPDGSIWMGAGDGIVRIDPIARTAEPLVKLEQAGQILFTDDTIWIAGGPTLRYAPLAPWMQPAVD